MKRHPKSISVTETFEVKAKSLKKGDSIWVGRRSYTVKSNVKNDFGDRVVRLKWGSNKKKDEVTLIVPSKLIFVVRNNTHTRHTL